MSNSHVFNWSFFFSLNTQAKRGSRQTAKAFHEALNFSISSLWPAEGGATFAAEAQSCVTTPTIPCCCRLWSGVESHRGAGDGSSRQRRAGSPGSDRENARNPRPLQLLLHGRCPLQVGTGTWRSIISGGVLLFKCWKLNHHQQVFWGFCYSALRWFHKSTDYL